MDNRRVLNNATPGTARAQLGDRVNELIEKHNALLAKLDADDAVTDSDYVATLSVTPLADKVDN